MQSRVDVFATTRRSAPVSLLVLAAALSAGAALIHLSEASEEIEEWWGYGAFFVVAAAAQAALAVLLLRDSLASTATPAGLYLVAVAGNAGIALLYAISRTAGVPLFGPDAGHVEELSAIGLVSVALEVALAIGLVLIVRRSSVRPATSA
jgi:energy-coupling factor transporter transmembrane protein EcfT